MPFSPDTYSPQQEEINTQEGLEKNAEQPEQHEQKNITPEEATDQANIVAKEVDKLIAKHDRFQSLMDRAEDRVLKQYDAMGIDAPQDILDKIDADSEKTMGRLRDEAAEAIGGWDVQMDAFSSQGGDIFELNEAISELADISGAERTVKPVEAKQEAVVDNTEIAEAAPEASNDNIEKFNSELSAVDDDLETMEMLGRDVEARRDILKQRLVEQLVDAITDRRGQSKSVDTLKDNLLDVTDAVKKFEALKNSDQFDLSADEIQDIRNQVIEKIGEDSLSSRGVSETSKKEADDTVQDIVGQLQKIA